MAISARVMQAVIKELSTLPEIRAKAWFVIWEDPFIETEDEVWNDAVETQEDRAINYTLAWSLRELPDRLVLYGSFGTWDSEPGKIADTGHKTVVPKSCVLKRIPIEITPEMLSYEKVTDAEHQ